MNFKDFFSGSAADITKLVVSIVSGIILIYIRDPNSIPLASIITAVAVFLLWTFVQHGLKARKSASDEKIPTTEKEAYFLVMLSQETEIPSKIESKAKIYFEQPEHIAVKAEPIRSIERYTSKNWQAQLTRTLSVLPKLPENYEKIHLVCTAPWLWSFMLGTRVGDLVPFQLYHVRNTLYPVWNSSDSIQEVISDTDFAPILTRLREIHEDVEREEAVLILNIGVKVEDDAIIYLKREHPNIVTYSLTLARFVNEKNPSEWKQLAAEIAWAVQQVGQRQQRVVYLMGSVPSALALMAGTAIRRHYRMQLYQHLGGPEYRKMLELPLKN